MSMQRNLRLLVLMCLSWSVVLGIAVNAQTPVSLAVPTSTPIVGCTAVVSSPTDSELKTQELILAELTCRRGESVGLRMENQGLRTENGLLRTWLDREIVRGDKLEKADDNSQKMDKNAIAIQTGLEGRLQDTKDDLAKANRSLESCQNNQKWIAGISFFGGGALGFVAGRQSNSLFGNNSFRPMPQIPYTLPNILKR